MSFSIYKSAAIFLIIPTVAFAETIEVFRLSNQPEFTGQGISQVYVVDQIRLQMNALSVGLPADPEAARKMAMARLSQLSAQDKAEIRMAADARVRAAEYRTPSTIVFA